MKTRILICILIWLSAIGVAAALDAPVAQWVREHGVEQFLRHHKALREAIKTQGFYGFTIALAIVVAFLHPEGRRAAVFLLLVTAVAALNQPLKWLVGRHRPFKIDEVHERLAPFEFQPLSAGDNLCFPSGHTALAFATAAALGMLWPRLRWAFYGLASVVAIERFAENAHWLSDTVAAAALGIGGAYLVRWLIDSWKKRQAATSRS